MSLSPEQQRIAEAKLRWCTDKLWGDIHPQLQKIYTGMYALVSREGGLADSDHQKYDTIFGKDIQHVWDALPCDFDRVKEFAEELKHFSGFLFDFARSNPVNTRAIKMFCAQSPITISGSEVTLPGYACMNYVVQEIFARVFDHQKVVRVPIDFFPLIQPKYTIAAISQWWLREGGVLDTVLEAKNEVFTPPFFMLQHNKLMELVADFHIPEKREAALERVDEVINMYFGENAQRLMNEDIAVTLRRNKNER